ncbi:MAG: M18 family aminopeptidase [Parasporobacterium sp.]|nr:M18 family aminopeptidase [Parasporobacterium sp.]
MNEFESSSVELCEFIRSAPSCFHVIRRAGELLESTGFRRLYEHTSWHLTPGERYYVIRSGSSLIAFDIPETPSGGFQIIASHCDSPTFKIKEDPEISKSGQYVELNVEKYGGMLYGPWFDRPLGIAGRLIVRQDGTFREVLTDSGRDLVLIPSLAIHMNRKANETATASVQTDLLPVFGDETASGRFMEIMTEAAGITPDEVLGNDLFLYVRTPYSVWGANREFVSSPRLDDLQCAYASLQAVMKKRANDPGSISVCCIFDNEEVGSETKQGADSTFLQDTLSRISACLGNSSEEHLSRLASSFMLSADNSHAIHPAHPEKADPVHRPSLNGGVVIKFNANQKYTTDAVSAAIFRSICEKAEIPVQTYVNHSDVPGGSTLGNISASHVSIPCADIGCPQLAMHSPYETTGIRDTLCMINAMSAFYSTDLRIDESGNYRLL